MALYDHNFQSLLGLQVQLNLCYIKYNVLDLEKKLLFESILE